MELRKQISFFFCCFCCCFLWTSSLVLLMAGGGVECAGRHHHHNRQLVEVTDADASSSGRPRKLFVFGDSYADTGNLPKIISPSWSQPYGITFPGKPAGRFSDGRVITDYLASFLGIRSPIPYKYRRYGQKLVPYGMNFAVGGSGVFGTGFFNDSLSVQIDNFKQQLHQGVFDLQASVAFVAISGNDYVYYRDNGGTMEGLQAFTPKVIQQLKLDLERLQDSGLVKVAVTNLHPIGCLPSFTNNSSYKECNTSVNLAVEYHNSLLKVAVKELNSRNHASAVVIINLFHGFTSVLTGKSNLLENSRILEPCCEAASEDYRCGSVDFNGVKKYAICSSPDSAFYWDSSHPTQAGWGAIFSFLRPSLNQLLN